LSELQHERILSLAQELRLTALPELYGPIAQSAAKKNDTSYADFLEDVLKAERDARRVRVRQTLTRTAGFPAIKPLEAYDFAFATGAPRSQSSNWRRSDSLSVRRTSSWSVQAVLVRRIWRSHSD